MIRWIRNADPVNIGLGLLAFFSLAAVVLVIVWVITGNTDNTNEVGTISGNKVTEVFLSDSTRCVVFTGGGIDCDF